MIFSVGLDRFLTAVAVSPTLRTAHRAVAPHHIKVRILSPRQVGYELRWAEGYERQLSALGRRVVLRRHGDSSLTSPFLWLFMPRRNTTNRELRRHHRMRRGGRSDGATDTWAGPRPVSRSNIVVA